MILKRANFTTYRDKFKNNVFYQNVAVVAGGNAAAKVIGVFTAPIITRLYTPGDYGIFSILLSIIGMVGSLTTLRYAIAIPIAEDEKKSDNLLKLSILVTFSLSIIWGFGILFFGKLITKHYDVAAIVPYLWILPIVFFGQGIYEALTNWALREKAFKLITSTKITQSIASAVFKIFLATVGIKPLGLFIGHIAQEYAGIGRLFTRLLKRKPTFFKRFSWKEIKSVAIRYKDFPLIQSWSQLLLSVGGQAPVIFIGALFGANVVGIFGLAQNMINMPMDFFGQSVSQVYFIEIAKFGKNNPKKIYNLSISIIKKMFWIGLIPVVTLLAFGPFIFKIVFGPQWYDAGVYARYLSIIILTRFISSPIANVFNVLEKQGTQLFLNLIRVILVVFLFILCNVTGFTAVTTIMLYSLLMSLFYILMLVIILVDLKQMINLKI
jgi:O-antigen/teichoic acid export membrane protein